jgi:hypothetical protein
MAEAQSKKGGEIHVLGGVNEDEVFLFKFPLLASPLTSVTDSPRMVKSEK